MRIADGSAVIAASGCASTEAASVAVSSHVPVAGEHVSGAGQSPFPRTRRPPMGAAKASRDRERNPSACLENATHGKK